ncbi:UBC22 [Symbiodinium sp. KB8]|nr:UBC22 [Symbiodinium sp. KB8]
MSIIAKQIKALVKRPLDGVRYVPDHGSLTEVHAIIQGPERTPYEGGEFRVKLMLGADYPSAPPKGVFLTKIYHPNISTAGDICVNTLKRDWKPEIGLAHVLQVVRCLLIVPFPESSLNDDAGRLFMESYDEFARRAKLMTGIHAKPAAKPAGAKKASVKKPSRKSTHDEGRGASTAGNENKKSRLDKSASDKASKKAADKKKKDRKALKRL